MATESKPMNIMGHLEEFRKRLLVCFFAWVLTTSISFFYVEEILHILVRPAGALELVFLSPPEALMVNIRLAVWAGILLAMPVFLHQLFLFAAPALYQREKQLLIPGILAMMFMFIAGVAFAYQVVLPFAITFFMDFATADLTPLFTITHYTSFAFNFLLTFGLVFQLPILFLLLGVLKLVTATWLRQVRKYAILVIFIGAAVITPPDAVSQLMVAVPLMVLYELGILLVMAVQFKSRPSPD